MTKYKSYMIEKKKKKNKKTLSQGIKIMQHTLLLREIQYFVLLLLFLILRILYRLISE